MGWKARVPRRYTDPQIKVMLILQKHGIRYESERGIALSQERGDGVWADVLLLDPVPCVRIECDDAYFKPNMAKYLEKDRRLKERYGIETVRLENRKIMLKSGEAYVLDQLKEWIS